MFSYVFFLYKVASIETAIESRKGSWSDFESFKYILAVRLGDFHLQMNAVIKNLVTLMPPKYSKDIGTLAYFANRIVVTHLVSNKPNLIKQDQRPIAAHSLR